MPATASPITTQADVLPRIARGDRSAVAECLTRYGGLVWSLASRMLGPGPEAEDVTQDVFITLWRKAEGFDPRAGCEATFIAVITRRRCIDQLRRRGARIVPEALPDNVAQTAHAPGHALETLEQFGVVRSAMDGLPADQQRALRLTVCDGLTHAQTAERLNLPLGTVKSHVRRGLAKLRQTLGATREATR